MNDNKNEIILYQPDNSIQLEVRVENETVWLTQTQMVMLFERDQSVISRHIRNIFKEGELNKNSVYAKFAYTATDGKIYEVEHYNLDVLLPLRQLKTIAARHSFHNSPCGFIFFNMKEHRS